MVRGRWTVPKNNRAETENVFNSAESSVICLKIVLFSSETAKKIKFAELIVCSRKFITPHLKIFVWFTSGIN